MTARKSPIVPLVVVLLAIGASIALTRVAPSLLAADAAAKLFAGAAACWLAAIVEDRAFQGVRRRSAFVRVPAALILAAAAFGVAAAGTPACLRLASRLGDRGTLAFVVLLGGVWLAGAATGSMLAGRTDSPRRSLRTSAAVALIGVFLIVAVLAGLVVRYGPPGFNALRGWYPSLFAVWAPFRPPAWPADSASNIPLYALVSWLLLLLYALAAALSGVGKLIAAATEPLVAMRLAFDEGARGQLSTRIRPAGPREASLLAESHGRMLDALANLRELERRFNPKSNAALERLRALASGGVLPPKERVATVLAAELRDVAANLRAAGGEPMVALFGRLFESVVAVADQFGGHVERLGSDMLLLIFNAPFEQDDHVVQGTRCAIELQKQIGALNRDAAIRSLGSFNLAIGVATGPIHVGTTSEHPDGARFVLVGDTIELAERLAALTPNGHVWVNQHNAETLPMYIPSVMLAAVNLRGRAQAVAPYRVWPPP